MRAFTQDSVNRRATRSTHQLVVARMGEAGKAVATLGVGAGGVEHQPRRVVTTVAAGRRSPQIRCVFGPDRAEMRVLELAFDLNSWQTSRTEL